MLSKQRPENDTGPGLLPTSGLQPWLMIKLMGCTMIYSQGDGTLRFLDTEYGKGSIMLEMSLSNLEVFSMKRWNFK